MHYTDFRQHAMQTAFALIGDPDAWKAAVCAQGLYGAIDELLAFSREEAAKIGESLGGLAEEDMAEFGGQERYDEIVRETLWDQLKEKAIGWLVAAINEAGTAGGAEVVLAGHVRHAESLHNDVVLSIMTSSLLDDEICLGLDKFLMRGNERRFVCLYLAIHAMLFGEAFRFN